MSGPEPKPGDEKITNAGCILTLLSLFVIFCSALPILRWRDPAGQHLPREVAIITPLLLGAGFQWIGSAILRLFGLRVLTRAGKEKSDWPGL